MGQTSSASGLGGTYGSSGKYHPTARGESRLRPPSTTTTSPKTGQQQQPQPQQEQGRGQGQGQGQGLEGAPAPAVQQDQDNDNDSGFSFDLDLTTPLSDTGEIAVGDRLGGLSYTDQIYPLAPQFQVIRLSPCLIFILPLTTTLYHFNNTSSPCSL